VRKWKKRESNEGKAASSDLEGDKDLAEVGRGKEKLCDAVQLVSSI